MLGTEGKRNVNITVDTGGANIAHEELVARTRMICRVVQDEEGRRLTREARWNVLALSFSCILVTLMWLSLRELLVGWAPCLEPVRYYHVPAAFWTVYFVLDMVATARKYA